MENEAKEISTAKEKEIANELSANSSTSLSDIISQAEELSQQVFDETNKVRMDQIKHTFYYIFNTLKRNLNGAEDSEMMSSEKKLKECLSTWNEKRKEYLVNKEKEQINNLKARLEVITKIEGWTQDAESIHEHINELREIQKNWKSLGEVSPEQKTELWKRYTKSVETFYDLLKMNIELRDYDFAKNLEIKTELCERAERLIDEENVLTAYQGIQTLQEEWRETGPVAKDLRAQIWLRFKNAVTQVNKRHNDFFAKKKEEEKIINAKKEELCQQLETLTANLSDASDQDGKPKNIKDWKTLSNEIAAISKQWKELHSKDVKDLYSRYKAALNLFFETKNDFFKNTHNKEQENKNAKQALINESKTLLKEIKEKAQNITTDKWRETSTRIKELQNQWKEIGAVPQRVSNAMWREFHKTTNEFFELMKQSREKSRLEKKEQRKAWANLEKRIKGPKEKLQKIENDIKNIENNLMFLRPQKEDKPNSVIEGLKSTLKKLKKEKESLETELKSQITQADDHGNKHNSEA